MDNSVATIILGLAVIINCYGDFVADKKIEKLQQQVQQIENKEK